MTTGKKLPFSKHTLEAAIGDPLKRCSPMALSSFFNDRFFVDFYMNNDKQKDGNSINKENVALTEYSKTGCGFLKTDKLVQQYCVFETNGKFSVPPFVLEEVFSDLPENGCIYAYFITIASQNVGMHKQILLRAKDGMYLIDSENTNVIWLSYEEYMSSNIIKRITNVSVLMFVEENQFAFFPQGYDINLFKHLI
jgi:hypothetical protein